MRDVRSAFQQGIHTDAGRIHRYIFYGNLIALIDSPGLRISGKFYRVDKLGPQKADQQGIQIFRPGSYDDLIRGHTQIQILQKVSRDCGAQGHNSRSGGRFQKLMPLRLKNFAQQLCPGIEGKCIR